MLAVAAGYFSMLVLNSLIHIITSVYFKTDLSLTGIAHLPSTAWVFGMTVLQFLFGLFGGLLTATIALTKDFIAILGFVLLITIIALMDYTVLNGREPLWYLITSPALKIAGIFTGYQLIQMQNKHIQAAE
jgi:hypothetical protein